MTSVRSQSGAIISCDKIEGSPNIDTSYRIIIDDVVRGSAEVYLDEHRLWTFALALLDLRFRGPATAACPGCDFCRGLAAQLHEKGAGI
jgi:hypothetical protein